MFEHKGYCIDLIGFGRKLYYCVNSQELDCMFFDTLEDAKAWIDEGCPVWEGENDE